MRGFRIATVVAILTGAAVAAPEEKEDRLVVHEWGTFTSMQGSDGVVLEGLHHEEEGLPGFVYSRTKVRECPLRNRGWKGLEVPVERVTQKMETPVLYFHSKTPRRLRVRVDFQGGLLTQWYPVSDLLGPAEGCEADGPLDMATVERSFLEWEIDVVPRAAGAPAEVPSVAQDDPWAFARDVRAAYVRTVPRRGPERAGPTEAEHYIFYRGLGRFELPLEVRAVRGGTVVLRNRDERVAIPVAFVVEIRPDGARWTTVHTISGGHDERVALGDLPLLPVGEAVDGLRAHMQNVLEKHGLFTDEAVAMVRTWSRQWFASEGTRVLWFVPSNVKNAMLPLRITPEPDEIERVLVGRAEYLTPEAEDELAEALRRRTADAPAEREAAERRMARFHRFLEPAVRAVLARTVDELVRRNGEQVLREQASGD